MAKQASTKPRTRKAQPEYFCVCVRRNYEDVWRAVSKHETRDEAQAELERRRGFTGVFNYDNADLQVMSRTEAQSVFGAGWDYKPIGTRKVKSA